MSNVPFAAQMEELAAYMASKISVPTIGIGGGYAPIGTINFFDATTAPQDWLACDGSVHNIADYPQLAEWYATQHGAANFYGGNGTTTFAVPNLQGEFLRGTGTNGHANQGSGSAVGVHQDATQIPYLQVLKSGNVQFQGDNSSANYAPINTDKENAQTAPSHYNMAPITANTYEGTLVDKYYAARPTNTSFLICVKAVVAGEVYSTEERVVGTWIGDKPVYQKVIQHIVETGDSNGSVVIDTSGNIDNLISIEGYIAGNTGIYNLPLAVYDGTNMQFGWFWASKSSHNLIFTRNSKTMWNAFTMYVVARYTKTTD